MLVAKLIVPITRKIPTDVLKLPLRCHQCDSKASCKQLQNVEKEILPSKCKEYQEKLAKCQKSAIDYLCCNKLFSKATPKCKTKSIIDDYQTAYQTVSNQADTILKEFRNETKSMIEQLTRDIESIKSKEQLLLQESLQNIKKTLQKLLALDPCFGSYKRKSAMSLSHQAHEAFSNVECDIIPQLKRIKMITTDLEHDVLSCIDRAKNLILSCRKCRNPKALTKCIEENASYAEKILEKASKNAKLGLNKIQSLQSEILEHHKETIVNVSQTYREKSEAFLEHLNKCISMARSMKK